MWSRSHTLAEFRLYTCLSEAESAEVQLITAYVTRCIISEYRYKQEFYPDFEKEQLSEDDVTSSKESNGDLTVSELSDTTQPSSFVDKEILENDLKYDHIHLSKRLSTLGLGNFELSSSSESDNSEYSGAVGGVKEDFECKEERLHQYLEGAAVLAEINTEHFSSDEPVFDWKADNTALMESMGLPHSFGSQEKKKRRNHSKKNKMSKKEIHAHFTSLWKEKGELLVYRSFASSYPEYASYYDQITGSIPPDAEVEIPCSSELDSSFKVQNFAVGHMNEERSQMANFSSECKSAKSTENTTGGQNVNDLSKPYETIDKMLSKHFDVQESNQYHNTEENVSHISQDEVGCIMLADNLEIKPDHKNLGMKEYNAHSTLDHETSSASISCADDASATCKQSSCFAEDLPSDISTPPQSLNMSSQENSSPSCTNFALEVKTDKQLIIQEEHRYSAHPNSHSYANGDCGVKSFYSDYADDFEGEDQKLNHDELIAMLKNMHNDIKNNIYWFVKGKVAEWFRENPDKEFDLSALDIYLVASNEPYVGSQELLAECIDDSQGASDYFWNTTEDEDFKETASNKKKSIPETLQLLGLTVEMEPCERENRKRKIMHGTVTYKRRSILKEAKRLHLDYGKELIAIQEISTILSVQKMRHIAFDDDGNPYEYGTELPKLNIGDTNSKPINGFIDDNGITASASDGQELDAPDSLSVDNLSQEDVDPSSSSSKGSIKKYEKKKKRQRKNKNGLCKSPPETIANDPILAKYWYQRYSLFQRFDEGIKLDKESWFSVTPEALAAHIAQRCRCDTIVDAFCGAGGNTIQFAFTCKKVIAIDIDESKLEMAKHNAQIYGVADHIEFIHGDYLKLASTLTADVVFLSPPWGGPEYLNNDVYDIDNMAGFNASDLMKLTRKITPHIAFYLPRNSDMEKLMALSDDPKKIEVEQQFLERKLKTLTAYFGDLILCREYDE